ncbi:dethiobiotin synthase [Halovenus sp. WSH3]|uniref:ATP-dependent dethiobiotin synthetase BioD n=1 Tax=Halovenus carboxidivorans TaxID=2692199 RepID=A0A6B0TBB4_9EURY|nr:dethiobiotin synthase [Halovenus carboxidivorans]
MSLAVVGTDTGIGKTVVTAGLVSSFRESGYDARAIKPAQTAFPEDDDAAYVAAACGEESAAVRLRSRPEPLAPAVAARRADDPISYESLLADTREALAESEVGIVEGAGGLRVPLSNEPRREIVDLVADLSVSAVVVARSGLGTLNHTALTVEALRRRDVPVEGVVLNQYDGETVAERTNPDELERMCSCPVWTVPTVELEVPRDATALTEHLPEPSALR